MSTKYTYAIATAFPEATINPDRLTAEIKTAGGMVLDYISTSDGTADVWLTSGTQAALGAVIAAHAPLLADAKQVKFLEIDLRTDQLFELGFQFPPTTGARYSLTLESQTKLIGLDSLRNDAALTYPVLYNSLDDLTVFSLGDAATVHSFFLVAVGTARYYLDSGTALKDQVRAATTVAEVLAVEDAR